MLLRSLVFIVLLIGAASIQPLAATLTTAQNVSTVDLGTVPRGVAVDSATGTVYVVLFLNGTTLALDAQTLKTVAKIPTQSPYAVAVDPLTDRVYVSQGEGGSMAVIDGSTNSVVDTVSGAGAPYSLAVDDPRNLIFAADTSENSLWVVNGSNNAVIQRIRMSTSALAVDPAAGEAFVGNVSSNYESGVVEVVSTNSLTVVHTVAITVPPRNFAVDPASHTLFVTSSSPNGTNFLAINDQTFQTIYSLRLGGSPNVVAVGSSHDVYVSDVGLNRLYEVDGLTGQVLFNSTGGSGVSFTGVTAMAFDNNTGALYLTENDVTSLIVLGSGTPSLSPYAYLLLATPAIASGLAGYLAILYVRRRARSKSKTSEGINGSNKPNGT